MNELKYELVDVDRLIPYINNARTHSADQVSKLASAIKEFGFIKTAREIFDDISYSGSHGEVVSEKWRVFGEYLDNRFDRGI